MVESFCQLVRGSFASGNQKVGKLLIVKISNINIVGFFPCSEAIHFLLKRIQLFSAWLYFMGWHLASGVWGEPRGPTLQTALLFSALLSTLALYRTWVL